MNEFFKKCVPAAALLLTGALLIQADPGKKLVSAIGQSSCEQVAVRTTNGFNAPRMKKGDGSSFATSMKTSNQIVVNTKTQKKSQSFEYIPDLKGMVVSASGYSINTISLDGTLTPVGASSISASMAEISGGCGTEDTYYTAVKYSYPAWTLFYAFAYNTETWSQDNAFSVSQDYISTDLTYDATSGKIYGCFINSTNDGYEFGTADYALSEKQTITTLPAAWNAIAADKDGKIYAIDMEGDLLSVDKTTGSTTKIGSTGYKPVNMSSATIDSRTNIMYWTVSTDDAGFLCKVDLTTGEAEKIADFPNNEEVYGLYVKSPAADDLAPAAPSNLSLVFPKGTLTGHITFDAPETLFRGGEASGNVNYNVYLDGNVIATGTTTYGAKAVDTPDFSVEQPGNYKFTIICYNEAGNSPKEEVEGFIGEDSPMGVTNAKAVYSNGVFTISWDAPTASANGGYINPENITYKVTRLPDNVEVASATSATSITDAVEEPEEYTNYKYSIVAEFNGYVSATVYTNNVGLGYIYPPYSENFDDASYTDNFTIIDNDGDGRTWGSFLSNAASYGTLTENATDDWLITPNIKLEAGKFYKISFSAATFGTTWTEVFDVMIGTSASPEAMTQAIFADASVSTTSFAVKESFEKYFSVAADGVYNIGFHHKTASNSYFLLIDNLAIAEPIEGKAPGTITDLVITPDANGAKEATISFVAPSTDLNGDALQFIEKIEVKCNDELLRTIDSPKPGEKISFTETFATSGDYTFSVTAYNGELAGLYVEAEAHIGINVPAAPTSVTAKKTATQGEVTLTWDAVTTDIDGKNIPTSDITYIIIRLNGTEQTLVANDIKETTFTYQALQNTAPDQAFYQYAVAAHNEAGYSNGSVSGMLALGAPYTIPYEESFTDGGLNYILSTLTLTGNGGWQIFGDQSFSNGVKSYDADNGMIGMYGPAIDDSARIFTGNISFAGLSHPSLSFYTYNLQASASYPDLNEITVVVDEGDGFKEVEKIIVNEAANGERGWAKVTVDLSEFAGKTIQLGFDAVTKVYYYTLIDNMSIIERYEHDLAITGITAPQTAENDETFDVSIAVENTGLSKSGDFKVVLYNNDKNIAEVDCTALESDQSTTVTIPVTLNVSNEERNAFYAEIVYSADENAKNNVSETVKTRLRQNDTFPTVRNLSVKRSNSSQVELIWDAPEQAADKMESITEDFESADTEDGFPTEFGNWTFVDGDKGYIGGIRNVELPGIQTGSQQSYWVMDASNAVFGGNTSYTAHSGTKYLAQMYTMNQAGSAAVQCNDWVISPWLCEKAQTVSFYANSYGSDTNERFQFLYSTTGTDISDFTVVETIASVPNEWTQYSFDIPDGAKYFAIRCTSTFQYMLFIDDITYIPANGSNLQLAGYNIYVDGQKLNASLLTDASYTDNTTAALSDDTKYGVSAVYTAGESLPVYGGINYTGINDILNSSYTVKGEHAKVIIDGAYGKLLSLYSVDGKVIYSGIAEDHTEIPAFAGVYILNIENKSIKVMVK